MTWVDGVWGYRDAQPERGKTIADAMKNCHEWNLEYNKLKQQNTILREALELVRRQASIGLGIYDLFVNIVDEALAKVKGDE